MKISAVIFYVLTTCFLILFAVFIYADGLPVSIGEKIHEKYTDIFERIGQLITRTIPMPPATKEFISNFSVFTSPGGKFTNFSIVVPSDNVREMFTNFSDFLRNVSTANTVPEGITLLTRSSFGLWIFLLWSVVVIITNYLILWRYCWH